jgi:putative nucleotidyltransferase with HDIG domain
MDYVPIRVSTLRGDQKIEFDTFIKINEKFILYLRRGDSFEGTRLDRLRGKKLKKMFINPSDEQSYRKYLTKNIDNAYDRNSKTTIENRTQIIQGDQQSHAEEVMENPENERAYMEAKDAAQRFSEFLMNEDSGLAHILKLENLEHSIAHHGVTVSSLSVSLAKKLGFSDAKQLQLLTLGALLHDFGHFNTPIALNRPLNQFPPDELSLYKNHPKDGATRVQDKKHFDQVVISIISQHEEYIDGQGFPLGLTESKMDPLAVITSSANALDRLITFEGVPKAESVKKLMLTAVGKHPLQHLQLLGDIMKETKL